jgi:hypothetical protein
MSNGKKPVRDSSGKIVKNLYQKADSKKAVDNTAAYKLAKENKPGGRIGTQDLIRSLNALKGIEVAKGATKTTLKSAANKIAKVIPGVAGKKKP